MPTLLAVEIDEKNTLSIDEALDIFEHDLAGADGYHDEVVDNINKWIGEYNGEPYGNEREGRSKFVWKLVKKQGESLIANLIKPFTGNYEIIQLDPSTEADVYKTKINEKLINHFWNKEFDPISFLKTIGRVLVPEGTAIIKAGWEYEYKEKRTKIPAEAFTEEMKERFEGRGARIEIGDVDVEIIVRKVLRNKPTAIVVPNEEIYVDPTASTLEDAKFIIHKMTRSLGELIRDDLYDKKAINKLKKLVACNETSEDDQDDLHDFNEYNFSFKDDERKELTIYEYWGWYDIDGDDHLEPVVATAVEYSCDDDEKSRMIIRFEKNPYPFGKPPFVAIPLFETPFKIFGRGLADVIGDEQRLTTSTMRGIIDNMANSNNGVKFVKKNALDPTNYSRLMRGDPVVEVNTTDPINSAIIDGNFNPIPANVFTLMQMLEAQTESLTGVSKMMQGLPGSELKSSSSNFAAMMTQSQIRLLDITNNITRGLKELFRMWISMSVEYVGPEEIKRITGLDISALMSNETKRLAAEFGVDQLPPDTAEKAMMLVAQEVEDMFNRKDLKYDIKMKVGTDGLKQIKIQNINMLMQQVGGLVQTGSVPPEAIKLLVADLAEQLDRPDIAQMINSYNPQPDPMQQKMAELQMAKVQAEVEKDKALAANAMARTENVGAKTKKDMLSTDADIANKYADVNKKLADSNAVTLKARAEAGSKGAKAYKDVRDAGRSQTTGGSK